MKIIGKQRNGVSYKGKFYEFGTIEYKNLMLIEGRDTSNKGTLLDFISQAEFEDQDIFEKN